LAAIIYDDGVVLDVSPALKAFMGAEGRVVGRPVPVNPVEGARVVELSLRGRSQQERRGECVSGSIRHGYPLGS